MPDKPKVYLDDNGDPIGTSTGRYLDDAGESVQQPAMNFATVNGQQVPIEDVAGQSLEQAARAGMADVSQTADGTDPNTLGTFLRHAGQMINPIPAGQMLPFPKALGGSGMDNPLLPQNIVESLSAVKKDADARWEAGDYVGAMAKYVESFIPILGPMMSHQGDQLQEGKVAAAAGDMAGIAAPAVAGKVLSTPRTLQGPRLTPTQNPAEAAAVEFGRQQGVPIDAATATGSQFVRNVQKKAGSTWGGASTTETAQNAQQVALRATGERLAERAHPTPVSPEQAGQAIREGVSGTIKGLSDEAGRQYGTFRKIEAATPVDVPVTTPDHVLAAMRRAVGKIDEPVIREMRRIARELESMPYQKGGLVQESLDDSSTYYVRGKGGASVYHDIMQAAPGTADMTRAEVLQSINQALETGEFTNAARGALNVARKRASGKMGGLSQPLLPPSAGDVFESMDMPVPLRDAKKLLRPVYDRMTRQLPVTQQRASPGLKAIENILNGPDFAPASMVDADLSAIKALSRGADLPELRDISRGLASHAVGRLERVLRDAVAKQGGPAAMDALESGRAATRAKWSAADVLKRVQEEPVQAFQQQVYSKDAGIQQLRKVAELAPSEMPKVGRAFLDDLMATATAEGGFGRTDRLFQKWQDLGPETRKVLFRDADYIRDLDSFFLLAKKIGQNPNPSGTAQVLTATQVLVGLPGYAIAKILHSPAAVKQLTKGVRLAVGPGKASKLADAQARASILRAAHEAGVSVPSVREQDRAGTSSQSRPPSKTAAPAAGR